MLDNSNFNSTSNSRQLQPTQTVALMPCGNLFEDFFDTIGITFEILRTEQTGGWMFNYIEALQNVNVETILIFISNRVKETVRFTHEPTGATICVLPAPFIHRVFRRLTQGKYWQGKASVISLDSYLLLPLYRLAQALQQDGCGAILFQDYENPSFDVCVLLGRFLRLPVFASFQGGNSHRSWIERWTRPLAIRACSGLIIGPQTEIQRVCAHYPISAQKIARIFNPMDVMKWRPMNRDEMRIKLGIPLQARVVICHGRIDIAHKGLDILLEAWQQICLTRSDRELRLLLVGTGDDASELHRRINAMRLSNVLWVDEYICDRQLLWQYLSAADVYTLPSRHEGFPVAPIEAMTCSLPVVAADAPGVADILEGGETSGGIVVPRENSTALAIALGRVLDNEVLGQTLGKQGRRRAKDYFSFQVIGQQMRNFLFLINNS